MGEGHRDTGSRETLGMSSSQVLITDFCMTFFVVVVVFTVSSETGQKSDGGSLWAEEQFKNQGCFERLLYFPKRNHRTADEFQMVGWTMAMEKLLIGRENCDAEELFGCCACKCEFVCVCVYVSRTVLHQETENRTLY